MAKLAAKERTTDKNGKGLETLKRKAFLFEEILSFLEDEGLGFLMEKTEKEKNIPLTKARRMLS